MSWAGMSVGPCHLPVLCTAPLPPQVLLFFQEDEEKIAAAAQVTWAHTVVNLLHAGPGGVLDQETCRAILSGLGPEPG
jgi:hypothetical protein